MGTLGPSKICTDCEQEKALAEFSKSKGTRDGLNFHCRQCVAIRHRRWYEANSERVRERGRIWDSSNPEKRREISRTSSKKNRATRVQWESANKEKRKLISQRYRERNADKLRVQQRLHAKRHKAEKLRTPTLWASRKKIAEIYALAESLTAETGMAYHVDHIVPLRSPIVCGLHCEANLQVLPAAENQSKSNRFWPDMP